MEKEGLELIISAVSGPASGVAVAMLCLAGFGWFLVKYLLPQQERALDKVLQSHDADRKLFEKSITTISKRVDKVEESLEEVAKDIKVIRERM